MPAEVLGCFLNHRTPRTAVQYFKGHQYGPKGINIDNNQQGIFEHLEGA